MQNQTLTQWLSVPAQYEPTRDGKVPLRRNPVFLCVRLIILVFQLLFSAHPEDAWVWLKSMYYRRRPLSFPMLWITFDAIRELKKRVPPGSQIFEYGAGHSTAYWAEHKVDIISVEDDSDWFGYVEAKIGKQSNVQLHFEVDAEAYVNTINRFSKEFDVVVVDGSYRKSCIRAAMPKLKPGGLLVVDNTDWHWFKKDYDLIPHAWERITCPGYAPFIGHQSETSIYLKPED